MPCIPIPTNFMQESMILIETLFAHVKNALLFMSVTGRAKKRRSCQVTVKDELLAEFTSDAFLLFSVFLLYHPSLRTNIKNCVRTT